jgi:hypothetical protein
VVRGWSVRRSSARCCFCGSRRTIEFHHVGGRQHAPHFTLPLCIPHHRKVTAALFNARIDMTYTPDRHERQRRVTQAVLVFLWQFLEED